MTRHGESLHQRSNSAAAKQMNNAEFSCDRSSLSRVFVVTILVALVTWLDANEPSAPTACVC
jgi:hypothetical protein